eukprot:11898582-Alexandrium_andersonii.AAC.1
MSASLVGSEMCIRDRLIRAPLRPKADWSEPGTWALVDALHEVRRTARAKSARSRLTPCGPQAIRPATR